ncbi:hypothetical protein [Sorangium cellulosum]|uniref:hypothetical protein n=1 Tax=Sorangium cellulosum TaxID=56 RepID=UPI000410D2BE|nr:hypothetical protein [Sorangium cellulosum]
MNVIESVVVFPGTATVTHVSSAGVVPIPIRSAGRFDELAQALGLRLSVPALVIEQGTPSPGGGTLVICPPDVMHDLEVSGARGLPWVVVVDMDRAKVVRRAEALGLAATVEVQDYANWVDGLPQPPAIYGRKELAERIGAVASEHPLHAGPRYARMTRAGGDLPMLLADYLAAYAEAGLPAP